MSNFIPAAEKIFSTISEPAEPQQKRRFNSLFEAAFQPTLSVGWYRTGAKHDVRQGRTDERHAAPPKSM